MLPIDLTGKRALVAGVSDDGGFGFAIAKSLAEAGATVCVGSWPPALGIFTKLLERGKMEESMLLADGRKLQFERIYPLDAAFDTLEEAPPEVAAALIGASETALAKVAHRCRCFADAGKDDFIGRTNNLGAIRNDPFYAESIQRVCHGRRIARVVFHDRDSHSTPFVLARSVPSRRIAILMDFAKALNIASILWCSIVPSAFMFKLHWALSENDLKK